MLTLRNVLFCGVTWLLVGILLVNWFLVVGLFGLCWVVTGLGGLTVWLLTFGETCSGLGSLCYFGLSLVCYSCFFVVNTI